MGLGDPPGTQPRTHIWDYLVTQGDYLDCPKPQKASEHTRGTSQFPKLMGHPQARAEGAPATVE